MSQRGHRFQYTPVPGLVCTLQARRMKSADEGSKILFSGLLAPVGLPAPETSLRDYRRLRSCERRLTSLLWTYGSGTLFRGDDSRLSRLHQRIWDKLAMEHIEIVYSLYRLVARDEDGHNGLLNEGLKALSKAIDTFDPARGICFITYASSLISRAFYRHLRSDSRPCYGADSEIEGCICPSRAERGAEVETQKQS